MSDAARTAGFLDAWKKYKDSGFEVTQKAANDLAATWKVKPPKLDTSAKIVAKRPTSEEEARAKRLEQVKQFWTAPMSLRMFVKASCRPETYYSQFFPKNDRSAMLYMSFAAINMSPFDLQVNRLRFNWYATMNSVSASGEYDELGDIDMGPYGCIEFSRVIKGKVTNPSTVTRDCIHNIYFYPRDAVMTVSGHWQLPQAVPLSLGATSVMVMWHVYDR